MEATLPTLNYAADVVALALLQSHSGARGSRADEDLREEIRRRSLTGRSTAGAVARHTQVASEQSGLRWEHEDLPAHLAASRDFFSQHTTINLAMYAATFGQPKESGCMLPVLGVDLLRAQGCHPRFIDQGIEVQGVAAFLLQSLKRINNPISLD